MIKLGGSAITKDLNINFYRLYPFSESSMEDEGRSAFGFVSTFAPCKFSLGCDI